MNVFDIIGPIMIGPSSSHTAGAVRLGTVARKVLNREPVEAYIELSGSFAKTYRGHGTDKALLAGIMGYESSDEEIRYSPEIAEKRGLKYTFVPTDIPGAHPNTARIRLKAEDGSSCEVEGASIGGGNIYVDMVNGMKVGFTGQMNTILVLHYDKPGLIAAVTNYMYEHYSEVNIGNFRLARPKKGGEAVMTIEIDGRPPEGMIESLSKILDVINVILIKAV